MKNWLMLLCAFCFSVAAWAGKPVDFDPNSWKSLLDHASQNGERRDFANGSFLILSRVVPEDPNVTHQADYFSLVGSFGMDGEFRRNRAEAVSESWVLRPSGLWEIDQWLFVLSLDGTVGMKLHRHLVRTEDGLVRQADSVPTTEKEYMDRWNALLKAWVAVQP